MEESDDVGIPNVLKAVLKQMLCRVTWGNLFTIIYKLDRALPFCL